MRVHPVNVELLKPLVDPVTGATYLRLLDYTSRREVQVTRIDLTLPEPCADDPSPMTVGIRHYWLPEGGKPTGGTRFQYVDASEEGHVRGFYRWRARSRMFQDFESGHVMKFMIDTSQDEWVIDYGKLSPVEWSNLEDTHFPEGIMFDGMRGKICFSDPTNYKDVVVVGIE